MVHADLWRKSHAGKTSSPSSIPSSVPPISLSLVRSLFLLFLSLNSSNIQLILSWSIHLSIFYLPREIHSRFLRSLFLLSPVRLLAFSQPFQWFARAPDERSPRLRSVHGCTSPLVTVRSFSLFLLLFRIKGVLKTCGMDLFFSLALS